MAENRSEAELEKLLDLAENLQDTLDHARSTWYTFTIVCLSVVLGSSIALGLLWKLDQPINLGIILAWALAVSAGGFWVAVTMRTRERKDRDARALREVLEIIRESQGAYAVGWSALDKARFRIRLARFDVGAPQHV